MGHQETEGEKEGEFAEGWRNISSHQLFKKNRRNSHTLRKADNSELSRPQRV